MSYIGNSPSQSAFVTDLFNGDNSTTAFTMSVSPANPASILVAVSGVLQSPDTYSVSGQTLNFSSAPPSATGNISVRYLGIPASGVTTTAYRTLTEYTATAGQTTFTPPSYTVGFINVFRNGVMLGTADYTASNGTSVVLANACASGDLVVVESFYVSSVLNAIPATANSVTQLYIGSGVAGTGPAFSVYLNGSQSISSATATKIQFNTEEFDTANAFDSTTNYRFTPQVAGYYQINAFYGVYPSSGSLSSLYIFLFKNGSQFKRNYTISSMSEASISISHVIYMNGSSDYLEVYAQTTGTSPTVYGNSTSQTYFSGALVRAA